MGTKEAARRVALPARTLTVPQVSARWPGISRGARYATGSERGATGAGDLVWGKHHAVTGQEALMTIDAAFFIAEEKMLGSIEKGKYTDVVVLNGDYMSVPENEIEKLEPVMTIVGGQVLFETTQTR